MKKIFITFSIVFLSCQIANALTYNFDSLIAGKHYTESEFNALFSGVSFNNSTHDGFIPWESPEAAPPLSGKKIVNIIYNAPGNKTIATFDSPTNIISVDMGQVAGYSYNLYLNAYDHSNNLIDSCTFFLPANPLSSYTMSATSALPNISWVEFYGVGYKGNAVLWDNFTFDPTVTVDLDHSYYLDTTLGSSISFDYWWEMGIDPPPYQGQSFDVLALQGGAGWQYIGQIGAYNSSTDWASKSLAVPKELWGLETQLRFILNDYGPETNPVVYLKNIETAPVPEPATMLLLGSGLLGFAGFRERFGKK